MTESERERELTFAKNGWNSDVDCPILPKFSTCTMGSQSRPRDKGDKD